MKLSNKNLRIKRKHLSIFSMIFFLVIGLSVTILLNTQISKQKQISKSNADEYSELICPKRALDSCYAAGADCYNTGTKCVARVSEPQPQRPGCGIIGKSCCPGELIGDGQYSNDVCSEGTCRSGICQGGGDDSSTPGDPPSGGNEGVGDSCTFNSGTGGTCMDVNNCGTRYESGHCNGGSNIKCCANSGGGDNSVQPPSGGGSCSAKGGTCQNPNSCNGTVLNNLCPGGQDNKCCVQDGGTQPNDSGPADPPSTQKPASPSPGADDPRGVIDQNDGHLIRGWAFDPNDTDKSIEVHIYIYPEGGASEGYNTGSTSTERPDVNTAYGIIGVHGFEFQVPAKWCDGKSYTADVYGINVEAGGNIALGGSTWVCTEGGQTPDASQSDNLNQNDTLLMNNFDGRWYLRNYEDVKRDKFYGKSKYGAFRHYLDYGMKEKRNPNPNFDEKYYLDNNPDVSDNVVHGGFRSGFEHYLVYGSKPPECRKPKSESTAPDPCGKQSDPATQSNSKADIQLTLQGIGAGANINDPVRQARVKILSKATTAYTATGFLRYDKASGTFVNHAFNLGTVNPGSYQLTVQMDSYLDQELTAPNGSTQFALGEGKVSKTAPSLLSAGDTAPSPGGDNTVDIIDYNALINCMPGSPKGSCINKKSTDLNNDGRVDQKDFDILKSNLGDKGFSFQTPQYTCVPDPACTTGKGSLQMCALLCTPKTQRS